MIHITNIQALLIGVPGGVALFLLCIFNPQRGTASWFWGEILTGTLMGIAIGSVLLTGNLLSWASLFLLGFPGMGYRIYKDWK